MTVQFAIASLYLRQQATCDTKKEESYGCATDLFAKRPPAEIKALIDAHINGFNTHDKDLFLSVFGDKALNHL